MALRWADGFDHYAIGDIERMWSTYVGTGTGSINAGRTGNALRFNDGSSNGGIRKMNLVTSGSTCIFGMAYRISQVNSQGCGIFQGMTGSTNQWTLQKDGTSALISLRQGSLNGTVINTSAYTVPTNTWIYVEIKIVLATTAVGSYEVRVNGSSIMSATGVITSASGTTWNGLSILVTPSAAASCSHDGDDAYFCDASGSDNNDFLGDIKIETLFPSTDAVSAGSNAGLTPSTGTDHGALVDETAPNTTDYNGSSTVGVKDTYNYPSLATTVGTVLGVMVCPFLAKSDAGARTMNPVVRVGGTDYDGVVVYPSYGSYKYFPEIFERDPTSTLWTISSVNSAEFGEKIAS